MGIFRAIRANRRFRRLQTAIDQNDPAEILVLLRNMESEQLLNDVPREMLAHACDSANRAECVRLLLSHGWGDALEDKDSLGRTPLHLSVERGDIDTVRVLLDAGADPNARDKDGITALNLCKSFHGLSDIAQLLLAAGGNPNLVDKHGKNYLM